MMRSLAAKFGLAFVVMLVVAGPVRAEGERVDFAEDVYPVLVEHCVDCHGPDEDKSGLRLHTQDEAFRTDYVIMPGKAKESELYFRVSRPADHPDLMPPEDEGGPLKKSQVRAIRRWIEQGAEWTDVSLANFREEPRPTAAKPKESRPAEREIDYARDIRPILETLPEEQRAMLVKWAERGAPMPDGASGERKHSRVRSGLQLLYDFSGTGGRVIRDRSGVGEPVDLRITEPGKVERSEGSLEVKGKTLIRSDGPAKKIVDAAQWSDEITIEAWVRPAAVDQSGPARIVTLSGNSSERNFTLGQDSHRFDVRLRTTQTSNNGLPSVSSADQSLRPELTHVVYTRDRTGLARIYINGEPSAKQRVSGTVSNWNGSFRLALADELSGGRSWRGAYHLVALYNRDLLPREVKKNYQAGADVRAEPSPVAREAAGPGIRMFKNRIAPILNEHCLECHDAGTQDGDLDLSSRAATLAAGGDDPVLVPGDAEGSKLWQLVKTDEMPDDRTPLSPDEKKALREWIEAGAPWPKGVSDPAAYAGDRTAARIWLRRLTVPEYIETVRSTLGVDISEEAREILPGDVRADGFSNTAYNLNVDLGHVQAYAKLAGIIVDRMDVVEFAEKYADNHRLTDDNMRQLVARMGEWVMRGPLEDHEINTFRGISTTVASAGGGFEEAVSYILEAMLQSPRFLYRMENQRGDGTRWPVGGYEMANRLSYTLWGAPPDRELMRAAESGKLNSRGGVRKQVERMLEDPRATARSTEFIDQWLNLARLKTLNPEAERFPAWSDQLAADMRKETRAFFKDVVWEQGRPLADLLNAQVTYATPRLAEFYGLDPKEGAKGLSRYDVSSVPARGGLLTQSSVLTIGGDEASMVARGLFVLREVLGGSVKDPPPCLDTSPVPTEPGKTQRAIAKARIADPSCGGCHSKFEPLAFGLEKFNGIGAHSERDRHDNKLRDDGEIPFPGQKEPVEYESSAEMMELLAGSERVSRTITRKVIQFALGRPLRPSDEPAVRRIHEQSQANGGTYADVITAIVTSDLMRMKPTVPSPRISQRKPEPDG